jgi:5-enolpyruvylshikimate-3-phosphate synthase
MLDYALAQSPTLEAWRARGEMIRKGILKEAGLTPLPRRTPLKPIIHSRRERDGYSVENVALETVPGFYLTGNLYRPTAAKPPYAAVLCTHGHGKAIPRFAEQMQRRSATLARMGARVEFRRGPERAGEPTGTLVARHGPLRGILVGAGEVPALIDEVPLLAVVATQAEGRTELRGAGELRVKESDRLARIAAGLGAMGARVEELADGLAIHGPTPLSGAVLDAASDHRIAMALAVAGLVADGETVLDGAEWADISWPGFFALQGTLSGA